jgi:uncharacterized protein YeaO (DUF488 family)
VETLASAHVGRLLDVRQRRGVRGPDYAWANARRLEAAMATTGIAYEHHRELAPTTELRHLQYAEDAREGVGKRSRAVLADEYSRRYNSEILDHVDLGALAESLRDGPLATLLCVERDPQACHRSLIAGRLRERYGARIVNLLPE